MKYFGDPDGDDEISDEDNFIEDEGIEIFAETLDKDFDEVDFDGTVADDSDQDAAERFGY